jgi:hypothetical protein
MGVNPAAAGLLGGMGGGIVQAYATMGKFTQLDLDAFRASFCDDSNRCSSTSASDPTMLLVS